jgi:hypothetical protein
MDREGGVLSIYHLGPNLIHQGTLLASWQPVDLVADGGYAYVVTQVDGLRVVDVWARQPFRPVEVGFVKLEPLCFLTAVAADVPTVFATDDADRFSTLGGACALRAFDVTNRAAPVAVGAVRLSSLCPRPGGIVLASGHAYVAGSSSITVVDVADRTQMRVVGEWRPPLGEYVLGLGRSGSRLVVSGLHGLWLLDLTDPTRPRTVATLDGVTASGMIGDGATIVAAGGGDGLYVVRHD